MDCTERLQQTIQLGVNMTRNELLLKLMDICQDQEDRLLIIQLFSNQGDKDVHSTMLS